MITHCAEPPLTGIVLTLNEAANIDHCLRRLTWLRRVVLVDSGSQDDTLAIARRYSNVDVFHRPFDNHAAQWNYALRQTGIDTEWVLCLDADYLVPESFVTEAHALMTNERYGAYRAAFDFVVGGAAIGKGLYGDVPVLVRRSGVEYVQKGHTQRAMITGEVGRIMARFTHHDRKSLALWTRAQYRYAALEANYLASSDRQLDWRDKVRRNVPYAPLLCFAYLLFIRGMLFQGRAARMYAYQRLIAESLLRLQLDEVSCSEGQPATDLPTPVQRSGAQS